MMSDGKPDMSTIAKSVVLGFLCFVFAGCMTERVVRLKLEGADASVELKPGDLSHALRLIDAVAKEQHFTPVAHQDKPELLARYRSVASFQAGEAHYVLVSCESKGELMVWMLDWGEHSAKVIQRAIYERLVEAFGKARVQIKTKTEYDPGWIAP
jgi:hypothetical protein